MIEKIFFQSSLPRSGSTVFSNIIAQNPDFYVTPTSGVLELVYAARANYTSSPEFKAQDSELMKKAFLEFCNKGVHGFFESITDKKYVLDKSRGWGIHYDFLNSFYPNPKIICMIREPMDIFCSMEKKFRQNQHKDVGMVNHAQMQGISTAQRIDIWANSQPIGLAFNRLKEIILQGIDKHMLFVRFEQLTMNPKVEMARVYEYLELPYFEHDFDNIAQTTKEDDEVYGIYGDHTIQPKLVPLKSSAREILGRENCEWIKNNYSWINKLYY